MKQDNNEYIEEIAVGLSHVFIEFGKVFAAGIPDKDRADVVIATAFCWLSEKMTEAVQKTTNYENCRVIEGANNVVRFGHMFIVKDFGNQYPLMDNILND
jgi:hypothetical protein